MSTPSELYTKGQQEERQAVLAFLRRFSDSMILLDGPNPLDDAHEAIENGWHLDKDYPKQRG